MRFTTDKFSYNSRSKTFTTDASTLGLGQVPQRLTLTNPETNGAADYYMIGTDKDESGEDIMGYLYKPTMESVQRNHAVAGTRVLIIND